MISACKHFPGLWNKQAVSVNSSTSVWGLPEAGSGAPPQALFLVPPTASSGTSAPSALPLVPWPEFPPLSGRGVARGGVLVPQSPSGCVPGGVEKDCVGGEQGASWKTCGSWVRSEPCQRRKEQGCSPRILLMPCSVLPWRC